MNEPITVIIRISMNPGEPVEEIPIHGNSAATLANAAFMAGVYFKSDHPGFEIVNVGDAP
jgi:hypothetical protein